MLRSVVLARDLVMPLLLLLYFALCVAVSRRDLPSESVHGVVVTAKGDVDVHVQGVEVDLRFRQLAISVDGHECLRCPEGLCADLEVGDRLADVVFRSCLSDPCLCLLSYTKGPP